jgi:hypothetical protein
MHNQSRNRWGGVYEKLGNRVAEVWRIIKERYHGRYVSGDHHGIQPGTRHLFHPVEVRYVPSQADKPGITLLRVLRRYPVQRDYTGLCTVLFKVTT